jgi:hypothetical protein
MNRRVPSGFTIEERKTPSSPTKANKEAPHGVDT